MDFSNQEICGRLAVKKEALQERIEILLDLLPITVKVDKDGDYTCAIEKNEHPDKNSGVGQKEEPVEEPGEPIQVTDPFGPDGEYYDILSNPPRQVEKRILTQPLANSPPAPWIFPNLAYTTTAGRPNILFEGFPLDSGDQAPENYNLASSDPTVLAEHTPTRQHPVQPPASWSSPPLTPTTMGRLTSRIALTVAIIEAHQDHEHKRLNFTTPEYSSPFNLVCISPASFLPRLYASNMSKCLTNLLPFHSAEYWPVQYFSAFQVIHEDVIGDTACEERVRRWLSPHPPAF